MAARRIKKTFFGTCEGQQEELYFNHLKKLINSDESRIYDVSFKLKQKPGSPLKTCSEANKSIILGNIDSLKEDGLVVSIFDNDFKDDSFKSAINFCNLNQIKMGYSNINFDLWLIMHKKYYKRIISSADGYINEVRNSYHLPSEADIKKEDIINKILEQITLEDVKTAINNANRLKRENEDNANYFIGLEGHYNQPCLQIHELIQHILDIAYHEE